MFNRPSQGGAAAAVPGTPAFGTLSSNINVSPRMINSGGAGGAAVATRASRFGGASTARATPAPSTGMSFGGGGGGRFGGTAYRNVPDSHNGVEQHLQQVTQSYQAVPAPYQTQGGSFPRAAAAGSFNRYSNLNPSWEAPPPPPPADCDVGGGMGKRMITVEVTGMQSATVRSNKVVIAKSKDLEAEGSALLQAYAERQQDTDGALVHTTVSGRLLDATTGVLVLEVYPFLVRSSMTATQGDMSDWVGAVREELAAGVHPAPCGLYARRVSKGVDAATLSGGDVLSAAKALVGVDSSITTSPSTTPTLQWSLHIQSTVVEMSKIKKEVEDVILDPVTTTAVKVDALHHPVSTAAAVKPTPIAALEMNDDCSPSSQQAIQEAAQLRDYMDALASFTAGSPEGALLRALKKANRVPLPDNDDDEDSLKHYPPPPKMH